MPAMSDQAVRAKTGKTWKEWFAILDKVGATQMSHKEIVAYINKKHSVGQWWQQMVTVTYEQARGMRQKHEKPEGYQISVSRTFNTSLPELFKAFSDENARSRWLEEDGMVVRKATPNKSIRAIWNDKKTSLEINFYAKADDKTQVVVQHSKLPDANAASTMKTYWGKTLDKLRTESEQ